MILVTRAKVTASFLMLVALPGPGMAQPVSEGASSLPAVQIPGTEVRSLKSSIDGQEYTLDIALPTGYRDASKRFPVVYLLDAQYDFPLVVGLLSTQMDEGRVPPLVLVAITWGGSNPNYDRLRTNDFTPWKLTNMQMPTGNGANFLAFVKGQLVPYIDSTYRTTQDRALVGHSLGGLFGVYVLMHEPELFSRYLAASPSIGWNLPAVMSDERALAARHLARQPAVYLTAGSLEGHHVPELQDFTRILKKDLPAMDITMRIIQNANHGSSKAEAYLEGLKTLYARYSAPPPR